MRFEVKFTNIVDDEIFTCEVEADDPTTAKRLAVKEMVKAQKEGDWSITACRPLAP